MSEAGISDVARRRLSNATVFTSTLSPAESVVARSGGMIPVGHVMGSSIAFSTRPPLTVAPGEDVAKTQAFDDARTHALARLQEEAAMLRAHAVIDVRIEIGRETLVGATRRGIELAAAGTAIRVEGMPPPTRPPPLTMLRADEVVKLVRAGYAALGLAVGSAFYFDPRGDIDVLSEQRGPVELAAQTRAWHAARDVAAARFRASAAALGAAGVIGTKIVRRLVKDPDTSGQLSLEIVLLGTAVARNPNAPPLPRPLVVVDLRATREDPEESP